MKIMIDLDGVIFDTYTEIDILHRALFKDEINWEALKDGNDKYCRNK